MKKTRPDFKLPAQLQPGQQQDLIAFLNRNSYAKGVDFCQEKFQVQTSVAALQRFWDWFHQERQLEEAQDYADRLKIELKELPYFKEHSDEISRIAQEYFEIKAMKTDNPKLHIGLRKLRLIENRQRVEAEQARQALKSDIERAMDAFFEEIKGNPAAIEAFNQFRARIKELTGK